MDGSLVSNTFSPQRSKIAKLRSSIQLPITYSKSFSPSLFGEKAVGINSSPHCASTTTYVHAESTHPAALEAVTQYCVVIIGEAVGVAQLVQLNPVEGVQL